MTKKVEELTPPSVSDKLEVTMLDGTKQVLFMSFGQLNVLAQMIGGIEQLPLMYSESSVREVILINCLSKRESDGSIPSIEEFNEIGDNLSVEQAEAILGWVEDHLTGFFIRALKRLTKLAAMTKS